jgi:hypothetical protein
MLNDRSTPEADTEPQQETGGGCQQEPCSGFSRCADCDDEMCLAMKQCVAEIHREAYEEEDRYIKAGVCSDCAARSLKEAGEKCRPRPLGCTGDYTCAGEKLWEDEDEE